MNPLSNIRIGPRLAIGFAIVLSLSVVSTSCALLSARDNAEATKLMMEQPLAKERLVSDWFTLNYSSMARTSMIAKSSDDALSATFADTIADTSKKISLLQEQISGLLSGDEEKTIYRDLVGARGAYLNAKTRVMEAKKAGDAAAAEHIYLDVFVPAAAAYQAKVQALLANQRKAINDTALSIEQANTRSFTLLVALSMLLIALGTVCAFLISRSITRPLRAAIAVAATVADGDLRTVFTAPSRDEIGDLMRALKGMNDALGRIVREVQGGTTAIASASSQIAAGNLDLSTRTEQQASSLEETASSMEQLTATVRQNVANGGQANQLAAAASEIAIKGGDIVGQVVETMGSIDASSRKIVDIIGVVDGIAFQTNILARNAAVEAARAGEQGRGFAVVASEVRGLAQRSTAAAKEIKELIGDAVNKVDIGTRLVSQAGSTMQEIVDSIKHMTDVMSEITAASQEQSAGIEQVNQAIAQMDEVTQQNAALVEQAAAAAASLQDQAVNLVQVVGVFKIDETYGLAGAPSKAANRRRPVAAVARRRPEISVVARIPLR